MSDRIALQNIAFSRTPDSDYGVKVVKRELIDDIVGEFVKQDAELGKPQGMFSAAAIAALQELSELEGALLSHSARRLLPEIIVRAKENLWTGPVQGEPPIVLPPKNRHEVFLTANAGFALDAEGNMPNSLATLGTALYHAGEWVQASFGSDDNLFSRSALDVNGLRAVLTQFEATRAQDLSGLSDMQRQQILGNLAGLLVELTKSIDVDGLAPTDRSEHRQLVKDAADAVFSTIEDPRLNLLIRYQLVGYLHQSGSFSRRLSSVQAAKLDAMHSDLNPEHPFDYDAWDAAGKSVIRVDHLAGTGEGFLFGFGKFLKEKGLGNARWRDGSNTFEVISGSVDDDRGPAVLSVTVPASDPMNAWGRDMTVELEISTFRNNMLRGLGRPEVDICGYDGHSGFGRNTLRSMPSAPEQQGDKLLYRFVCAGMDTEGPIAEHAPRAYLNSYTTQDSGYFRTKPGGPRGDYAYEAEGWLALRCIMRGVLSKGSHKDIQQNMKTRANWWGHSPGNSNNFVGPGDSRRGDSSDWDGDGISNMYDCMPTSNMFDIEASTESEFSLRLPDVPASQLKGGRAFQAIQFVNTATNYSTLLKSRNLNRSMTSNPLGVWFDGAEDPQTYVKFTDGPEDKLYVQFSSALAHMSMPALRSVLFYETSRRLLETDPHYSIKDQAGMVAAGLMFATGSLQYDMSWRDRPVFEGLKRLYGIPKEVLFSLFNKAVYDAADRHNYLGDTKALTEILATTHDALNVPGVGDPAVAVEV